MSEVDEIKQRIDIVDLVSQFVTLKRAGRSYTALCPFHTERTPSFHVDPARQSWHCFGACGTGGDIFAFVMKKDGVEFRDALHTLAERAGVSLESRRDPQEDTRRARMYDLNEAASAYFHAVLASTDGPHAAKAQVARDYVAERKLADASVEMFQLGYAPNSWDALTGYLTGRGFSQQEIVTAGLAVDGDRGVYDRFRHRLMFPIRDERGRVAGFGGRLLPGDALGAGDIQPKYVNTSQSPIFDKGSILYGLDLAKDAVRTEGQAVIVEGYMDAIAAHEHGYHNVVASMGTALTERQVALLKRHSSTLILSLDADNAGSEATIRSAYEIINSSLGRRPEPNSRGIVRQVASLDIDLRVLAMPAGRDPDEVIRTSPELWPELVAQAKPVLDHLFDVAASRHDLSQPRERSAAATELMPIIALTADPVVQSHYMQRLARMAQVDEKTLRLELRQPVRARAERAAEAVSSASNKAVRDRKEEFCLALLFRYPELRADGEELDPGLFAQSENRALFETWAAHAQDAASLEASLTSDLRPQYERIIAAALPAYDDDNLIKALRSTVWGIEQQRLRLAKRASASVLADIAAVGGTQVAERARAAWQSGGADVAYTTDDETDPAAAFVDDMEAGRRVHQRLLDQRDAGRHAPRGGE
jgi:DNA primase